MYTIHIQPKKQFKVQIIGILEETTPFIGQICTFEKVPKEQQFLLRIPSLSTAKALLRR